MKYTYTRKEVSALIEQAFWDGVDAGKDDDYAGEFFSPDSYLDSDELQTDKRPLRRSGFSVCLQGQKLAR